MRTIGLALMSLILVVVLALAWLLLSPKEERSDAVSAKDAQRIAGGSKSGPSTEPTAEGRGPRAGTYRYEGSGSETVKALGTTERTLPDSAIAVVKPGKQACDWQLQLVLSKDHVERFAACAATDGATVTSFGHEVGATGGSLEERFTCDTPVPLKPARPVKVTCHDGEYVDAAVTVRSDPATVTVEGRDVDAAKVTMDVRYTKETRGTEHVERWIAPDGTVLRVRGSADVEADLAVTATYRGAYDYTLASLKPE